MFFGGLKIIEKETKISREAQRMVCKYGLLNKIYEAKKAYYGDGSSKMTDAEYDALESSFVNIFSKELLQQYTCVGYDKEKHQAIINCLDSWERRYLREWGGGYTGRLDLSDYS